MVETSLVDCSSESVLIVYSLFVLLHMLFRFAVFLCRVTMLLAQSCCAKPICWNLLMMRMKN